MSTEIIFEEEQTHFTIFDEGGGTLFDDVLEDMDSLAENRDIDMLYLEVGTLFVGKYIIKKVLGQGALGIAYIAEEIGSKNLVVIKEFFPKGVAKRKADSTVALSEEATQKELQSYENMKKLFEEEAQNIVRINQVPHKNIAGFISLERDVNNTIYYLMPYSEGEEMGDYLKRVKEEGKVLSQKEIMELVEPILNGLSHIHKYGVYHKDIKPANIYIRKDDEPMLIDFGASVTSAHLLTPAYAPIEQVNRNLSEYGAYTDLYALGVMMYEMVMGYKPPKSKLRAEAISRGELDPYVPLKGNSNVRDGFEQNFLEAIDKVLSLSYQNRPQTAKLFKEELRGDIRRKKFRQRLLWLLVLFGLLGVIGYGVYDKFRDRYGYIIIPNSENSHIFIDNRLSKPQSDGRYRLLVGKHTIEIRNPNIYLSKIEDIKLSKEGQQKRIDNSLIKRYVAIEVHTQNDEVASLEINNRFVGNTPYYGKIYYTGLDENYTFVAKKDGYESNIPLVVDYKRLMREDKNIFYLPLRKREGEIKIQTPVGFKVKINGELLKDKKGHILLTPLTFKRPVGIYRVYLYSSIREKGVKVYKPILRQIEVKDKQKTIFPQLKAQKSKRYLLLQEKRAKQRGQKGISSQKRVLKTPQKPILAKEYNGVRFAQTEVTYGELVRFLNATKPPFELMKKYFFVSDNSVAKYIKIERKGKDKSYFVYSGYEDYPVVHISWYGAKAYIEWLNRVTNSSYRLASLSEWKSVATLGDRGEVARGVLHKVKSQKANILGIYDLYGNVAEWAEDSFGEFSKVILGGSFRTKEEFFSPTMFNSMNAHSSKNSDIGFRLVK